MTTQRARQTVGSTRVSALGQIIGLLVLLVTVPVAGPASLTIAAVYFVVMILMKGGLDRSPQGNGFVVGMLRGIPLWYLKLWMWAGLNRPFPGYLPSRA